MVMATGKIIKRTVDALISASVADFLWDNAPKGFGLKILPSGRASAITASPDFVCLAGPYRNENRIRPILLDAHAASTA
jgi:hypothetical protein